MAGRDVPLFGVEFSKVIVAYGSACAGLLGLPASLGGMSHIAVGCRRRVARPGRWLQGRKSAITSQSRTAASMRTVLSSARIQGGTRGQRPALSRPLLVSPLKPITSGSSRLYENSVVS